jgi:hypothetical protein
MKLKISNSFERTARSSTHNKSKLDSHYMNTSTKIQASKKSKVKYHNQIFSNSIMNQDHNFNQLSQSFEKTFACSFKDQSFPKLNSINESLGNQNERTLKELPYIEFFERGNQNLIRLSKIL